MSPVADHEDLVEIDGRMRDNVSSTRPVELRSVVD